MEDWSKDMCDCCRKIAKLSSARNQVALGGFGELVFFTPVVPEELVL